MNYQATIVSDKRLTDEDVAKLHSDLQLLSWNHAFLVMDDKAQYFCAITCTLWPTGGHNNHSVRVLNE
jgi:hypothetical protein